MRQRNNRWIGYLLSGAILLAAFALGQGLSFEALLLLMGILFIGIAVCMLILSESIIRNGVYTSATVVETVAERIPGASLRTGIGGIGVGRAHLYHPVLKYDVNECTHDVKYHGFTRPKYKDGETVKIKYSRDKVEKVAIVGDNIIWIGAAIFALAGLAMIGVGLFMQFS